MATLYALAELTNGTLRGVSIDTANPSAATSVALPSTFSSLKGLATGKIGQRTILLGLGGTSGRSIYRLNPNNLADVSTGYGLLGALPAISGAPADWLGLDLCYAPDIGTGGTWFAGGDYEGDNFEFQAYLVSFVPRLSGAPSSATEVYKSTSGANSVGRITAVGSRLFVYDGEGNYISEFSRTTGPLNIRTNRLGQITSYGLTTFGDDLWSLFEFNGQARLYKLNPDNLSQRTSGYGYQAGALPVIAQSDGYSGLGGPLGGVAPHTLADAELDAGTPQVTSQAESLYAARATTSAGSPEVASLQARAVSPQLVRPSASAGTPSVASQAEYRVPFQFYYVDVRASQLGQYEETPSTATLTTLSVALAGVAGGYDAHGDPILIGYTNASLYRLNPLAPTSTASPFGVIVNVPSGLRLHGMTWKSGAVFYLSAQDATNAYFLYEVNLAATPISFTRLGAFASALTAAALTYGNGRLYATRRQSDHNIWRVNPDDPDSQTSPYGSKGVLANTTNAERRLQGATFDGTHFYFLNDRGIVYQANPEEVSTTTRALGRVPGATTQNGRVKSLAWATDGRRLRVRTTIAAGSPETDERVTAAHINARATGADAGAPTASSRTVAQLVVRTSISSGRPEIEMEAGVPVPAGTVRTAVDAGTPTTSISFFATAFYSALTSWYRAPNVQIPGFTSLGANLKLVELTRFSERADQTWPFGTANRFRILPRVPQAGATYRYQQGSRGASYLNRIHAMMYDPHRRLLVLAHGTFHDARLIFVDIDTQSNRPSVVGYTDDQLQRLQRYSVEGRQHTRPALGYAVDADGAFYVLDQFVPSSADRTFTGFATIRLIRHTYPRRPTNYFYARQSTVLATYRYDHSKATSTFDTIAFAHAAAMVGNDLYYITQSASGYLNYRYTGPADVENKLWRLPDIGRPGSTSWTLTGATSLGAHPVGIAWLTSDDDTLYGLNGAGTLYSHPLQSLSSATVASDWTNLGTVPDSVQRYNAADPAEDRRDAALDLSGLAARPDTSKRNILSMLNAGLPDATSAASEAVLLRQLPLVQAGFPTAASNAGGQTTSVDTMTDARAGLPAVAQETRLIDHRPHTFVQVGLLSSQESDN